MAKQVSAQVNQTKVKSADRALEVMELLVKAPRGLIHTELALALGIPKSSLTKILSSLILSGYVQRIDGTTYIIGDRWRSLVKSSISGASIDEMAQPTLERITQETGETSGFNMIVSRKVETISTVASSRQLQFIMRRGERAPLHKMSSGRVILANLTADFQNLYYKNVIRLDRTSSFSNHRNFRDVMAEIRERGYSEVDDFREGTVGLAYPILSAQGRVKASINVATPTIRYDKEQKAHIIQELRSSAADLAKRLDAWIDEPEEWL